MDASGDLLAQFDRSATTAAICDKHERGVAWVLRRAAALGVLAYAAGVLAEFGYCLAAERALTRAARAGALEATLPRATYHSVAACMERRLTDSLSSDRVELLVEQNSRPVRGRYLARQGDRFAVSIASPRSAVVPRWLRCALFWRGETQIVARAESRIPGAM